MAKRKPASERKSAKGPTTPTPENDDSKRELFLHHRGAWNSWRAKVKAVEKIGDELKKTIKGDGFLVKEFQIADQLAEQRGEIKIKSEVAMRLRVARWIGHPLGAQLDLFSSAAIATADPREEGKTASMTNQPRKPPEHYPADSRSYADWMTGYNEHQAVLAGGIGHATNREVAEAGDAHVREHSARLGTEKPTHELHS